MVDFNQGWSVASVFNVYGLHRYHSAEMLYNAHRRSRQLRWLDNQSTQAASVADCIRRLGYTVKCCWTEESGRYVILSIQTDMEFCYGSRESGICNHCPEEHQRSYRYLAGHRTIYEMADYIEAESVWPAPRLCDLPLDRLRDISGEIEEQKINQLIDDGCISNIYNTETYMQGVSTLGNTLPPDIVEALQDFRSSDLYFVEEPDYEFYIPGSTPALPPVCPTPEASFYHEGGGTGVAAGSPAAAVAVAAHQTTVYKDTSSTSDSSDSDDNDC